MKNEHWDEFLKLASEKTGTPERILELVAIYDILELAVAGYCNKSVAMRLGMQEDYVSEVIQDYLDFPGFYEDQDINLITADLESLPLDKDKDLCYNVYNKFTVIRKELDEYYAD